MRFFYWIDRYTEIYGLFSALLVALALLLVAKEADRAIEADRDVQLAEKLVTYTSTLEGGTINSRARGAVILFGQINREAQQMVAGKLPPGSPQVVSALGNLRTLFFNDVALLLNQHGLVVAYSSQNNVRGTGADLSFRPYAQLAMQG